MPMNSPYHTAAFGETTYSYRFCLQRVNGRDSQDDASPDLSEILTIPVSIVIIPGPAASTTPSPETTKAPSNCGELFDIIVYIRVCD